MSDTGQELLIGKGSATAFGFQRGLINVTIRMYVDGDLRKTRRKNCRDTTFCRLGGVTVADIFLGARVCTRVTASVRVGPNDHVARDTACGSLVPFDRPAPTGVAAGDQAVYSHEAVAAPNNCGESIQFIFRPREGRRYPFKVAALDLWRLLPEREGRLRVIYQDGRGRVFRPADVGIDRRAGGTSVQHRPVGPKRNIIISAEIYDHDRRFVCSKSW